MSKAFLVLFLIATCELLAGCDASYWEPVSYNYTPSPRPVYTVTGKVVIDQSCYKKDANDQPVIDCDVYDHLPSVLSLEATKVEAYAVLIDWKNKLVRWSLVRLHLIRDDTGHPFAALWQEPSGIGEPGKDTPDTAWGFSAGHCYGSVTDEWGQQRDC